MEVLENAAFQVSPIDLEYLHQTLGGHVERRHNGWAVTRLVGHLALPSGTVLRIRSSKATAASLLAWMAFVDPALSGLHFLPRVPSAASEGDVAALTAKLFFAELFEALTRNGITRRYRREPTLSPVVRGGIDFAALSRMGGNLSRLPCRVWERLPDTPLNRLLAVAIEVVGRDPVLRPVLQRDLGRARAAFLGIPPSASADVLSGRVVADRAEAAFGTAHALARIIVRRSHLGDGGALAAPGFLVNLEALFERTVARALAACGLLSTAKTRVPYWRVDSHGTEAQASMEADVVIDSPMLGPVVVDAKYKASISSANLQQIVTYCLVLGARLGVLIVPAGAVADRRTYVFEIAVLGAVRVHVVELQTTASTVADWKANATALGATVRERIAAEIGLSAKVHPLAV